MGAVLIEDCLRGAQNLGKRLESELIMAHVLTVSREWVFSHPERVVGEDELTHYRSLWGRVEAGEPLAYVLGHKEFFGLDFQVDSRVLIPRPETEALVEAVLNLVKDLAVPRILDVGTGSGAIALALAHSLPGAQVWASDVSKEALEVARANAVRFDSRGVEFFESDLLLNLDWESWKLDVLVANLPYIGTETFDFVEAFVEKYEPSLALFGGLDGLDLYGQLFEQINCSKKENWPRWVVGEFGSLQKESLSALIKNFFPLSFVTFCEDLAGLDRFFIIKLNHD